MTVFALPICALLTTLLLLLLLLPLQFLLPLCVALTCRRPSVAGTAAVDHISFAQQQATHSCMQYATCSTYNCVCLLLLLAVQQFVTGAKLHAFSQQIKMYTIFTHAKITAKCRIWNMQNSNVYYYITFVQIRTCSYSIFSKNVYSIAWLYSFVLLTVLA